MKDKVITVLYGGESEERSVSLRSGENVMNALKARGYNVSPCDPKVDDITTTPMDVAFIALHGQGYEDGALQALLKKRKIPYTGSGIQASRIGMDKQLTKQLCIEHQLPIPRFKKCVEIMHVLPEEFTYPVIVKPLNEGSSVNVFIADNDEQLQEKTQYLMQVYSVYFIEEFIEGKELTVGVINTTSLITFPVLELLPKNRFYDYEAKYTPGMTQFVIPAQLSSEETIAIQKIAESIYHAAQCSGAIRVDFRWSPTKGPFVLEFNTVPGLTETSDLPAQAKEFGWSFEQLIEEILQSARMKNGE